MVIVARFPGAYEGLRGFFSYIRHQNLYHAALTGCEILNIVAYQFWKWKVPEFFS